MKKSESGWVKYKVGIRIFILIHADRDIDIFVGDLWENSEFMF
jgi:hypothetical protein